MTDTLDTTTVAATVERQKLQRHFGRFDILFFLICTIVGGWTPSPPWRRAAARPSPG